MPGRYGFPRTKRLTKKPEFDHVFQHGKKRAGPHFVCYAIQQGEKDSRLGLVVSRKVGGAVVRNRVKRYIRHFFRTHSGQFSEPLQLVVIARHTAAQLDYAQSVESLTALLRTGHWLRD